MARPIASGRAERFVQFDDDAFITECIEIAAQELSHRAARKHTSSRVRDVNQYAANRAFAIYVARKKAGRV